MRRLLLTLSLSLALAAQTAQAADDLAADIAKDYRSHLGSLFEHFHRNPELSHLEFETAKRLAKELRAAGFKVTEGVGKTGIVAMMENGAGPLVMMRADMDGLPVLEKSGLAYASTAKQKDWDGNLVPVMHACGHDVHITSLVGTAKQMAKRRSDWSGTLMLIGQPAEERVGGAKGMMADNIWKRFGQPDYAMAFHVSSEIEAGKLVAVEGSPYSGVDSLDIIVPGIGAHGASPHRGKDPVVIGAQIVLALQTIVSREIAPKEPAVITVGSFHAGTKHNIISDQAKLQVTVRNDNLETREYLMRAIERVAVNTGRAAGLPEDNLPRVIHSEEPTPPTVNDIPLTQRLKAVWRARLGEDAFDQNYRRLGMGAEDFPFFTIDPYIPSVYFAVGGTPKADFEREAAGGAPVPSHHSPLFKISPQPAITKGVEATVIALMELLQK
ncbi:amidohydrolase [Exilibacterium tricleocarpae]|uniref:Amidohydrolase n=1 Tax=Exilibacterium tricleocarpae TaxID=2591008 RepID=A0A545T5W2_9GAMM|nr:amidohydrolase [Exilibacterium tricleocarpae]TQV72603.1 amidohydrolase [Exilibacterium tricleocarpae]